MHRPDTVFPWYLKMGYPESIRQLFLDMIGDAVGYKINAQGEGLGDVTFHAYENGIVAFATKGMESQEKSTIRDVMNEVQLQTRIEEGWLKTSIQMEPAELLVLKIKIAS